MSNYIGYCLEDNIRRKENNVGDSLDIGPNQNVKSYSSKPGQLSSKSQAQQMTDHYAKLNRKQPCKELSKMKCPLERSLFLKQIKKVG